MMRYSICLILGFAVGCEQAGAPSPVSSSVSEAETLDSELPFDELAKTRNAEPIVPVASLACASGYRDLAKTRNAEPIVPVWIPGDEHESSGHLEDLQFDISIPHPDAVLAKLEAEHWQIGADRDARSIAVREHDRNKARFRARIAPPRLYLVDADVPDPAIIPFTDEQDVAAYVRSYKSTYLDATTHDGHIMMTCCLGSHVPNRDAVRAGHSDGLRDGNKAKVAAALAQIDSDDTR